MTTPAAAPAATGASSAPASSPAPSTSSSPSPSPSSAAPSPAPGSPATPNEAPKGTAEAKIDAAVKAEEARKWKLKGSKGEIEVDEAEMIRRAQLGYGADEKFQEAAQMRKSAEAVIEALKKDPLAVLRHPELGINVRELAENFLAGELQREMLPPEQRELEDLRAWKQQQEAAAAAAEQENMTRAQQQEFQQHMQRAAQEYDTKITDVLASSNLPKTAYTVKRVAELLKGALTKGYDLDVATAVDMVREGYMTDFKALFGGLKGEQLVKFLGDDVSREMRQYDLARIKAKLEAQQVQPDTNSAPPAPRQNNNEPKQLRPDEWKEEMRRRAGL